MYERPLLKEHLADIGLAWHWTCCSPGQEPIFRALLARLRPQTVTEIGTHQGVSAALLAEYATHVITIDVLPNPARKRVWERLCVADRIEEHVHKSSRGRDAEIARAVALSDLAFVDGSHLMPDIERDFALCIPCGTVILHDYWLAGEDWPDVKKFVDALDLARYEVEIQKPFVLVQVRS